MEQEQEPEQEQQQQRQEHQEKEAQQAPGATQIAGLGGVVNSAAGSCSAATPNYRACWAFRCFRSANWRKLSAPTWSRRSTPSWLLKSRECRGFGWLDQIYGMDGDLQHRIWKVWIGRWTGEL